MEHANTVSPLSPEKAVHYIKSQCGNSSRFKIRARGFIDWKFGELAEYKGYTGATQYAEAVLAWHDFDKYRDCLLVTSYTAFLEADQALNKTENYETQNR